MADQLEYDVFLSHASADKPTVLELAQRLKADGLRVWLDDWTIQPGDSIPLAIEQGLENSRTLVLIMSQAAFDSEWVTLERHTTLFRDPTNQQRRFIPLRFDACEIKDSLKQFAYVDWRKKNDAEYTRLLRIAIAPRSQWINTSYGTLICRIDAVTWGEFDRRTQSPKWRLLQIDECTDTLRCETPSATNSDDCLIHN